MADNQMNTLIKVGMFAGAAYLAYKQGWLAKLGIGTATPETTTPATAATTPATTTPAAAPAPSTLDLLYGAMVAAASAGGVTTTGPDGWNYYLAQVAGFAAPDPADVFPGVDRSVNMTSAQYWAGMSAWLQKNKGMSGGIFGGLAGLAFCGGLC